MKSDVKTYKPITPGLRQKITVKTPEIWKGKPLKKLVKGMTKTGGRNNQGKITMRFIGGGHKRLYRDIDHKRENGLYTKNEIIRIEYDPNRSGNIALCKTLNTETPKFFYILAPHGVKEGYIFDGRYFILNTNKIILPKIGESLPLKHIPIGTNIYNVEMKPGEGGKISKAAGTFCTLVENLNTNISIISLPSNKKISISSDCLATVGQVSNINNNKIVLGKAGSSRWLGIRPRVRGEAMNPIDHPHGGNSHGHGGLNNQPRTKWGKLAKWKKTSRSKR